MHSPTQAVDSLDDELEERIAQHVVAAPTGAIVVPFPPTPKQRPIARGSEAEVGKLVLEDLARASHIVFTRGDFFRYEETTGVYERVDVELVNRLIQSYDGAPVGTKKLTPLKVSAGFRKGVLSCAAVEAADREFFEKAVDGFAFRNVFVRIDAHGIHTSEHSRNHRAIDAVSFNYDEGLDCPRFKEFLNNVFHGDVDRIEKMEFPREFIGAALSGIATTYEAAAILVGGGSNGKGVLLDVLECLFPRGTVAAVPPQDWSNDYKLALLEPV